MMIVTLAACMDMLFAGALVAVARRNRKLLWGDGDWRRRDHLLSGRRAVRELRVHATLGPGGQLIFKGVGLLFGAVMGLWGDLGAVSQMSEAGHLRCAGLVRRLT